METTNLKKVIWLTGKVTEMQGMLDNLVRTSKKDRLLFSTPVHYTNHNIIMFVVLVEVYEVKYSSQGNVIQFDHY